MRSHAGTIIVLSLLVGLGFSAVVLSITILRRWVLISLLVLFAVFVIWFPVWMTWPNSLISRILLGLFGLAFFVVGITFKWLTPLVDAYVKQRGWHLR